MSLLPNAPLAIGFAIFGLAYLNDAASRALRTRSAAAGASDLIS